MAHARSRSSRSVPITAINSSRTTPTSLGRSPRSRLYRQPQRQYGDYPGLTQPTAQHNIISRDELKKKLSEIDVGAIVKTANNHNEYVDGERTLKNLPRFDECEDLISGAEWRDLLQKEIGKLVDFSKNPSPPLFDSQDCLQSMAREDFNFVAGLADQICCNLSILQHENARVVIEKSKSTNTNAWSELLKTRKTLSDRYVQTEAQVEGCLPRHLDNADKDFRAYCALLDYILAVSVWWIVRSVFSKYLEQQVFATLARWAIKLKALAKDPVRAAEQALSDTSDLFTARKTELEFRDEILIVQVGEKKAQINMSDTPTDPTALYFDEKQILGEVLGAIMNNVLATLDNPNRSPTQINSFEICTLVYQTGLEGETTMLHGARDGGISTSSNLQHINFCFNSYLLLKSNTESIHNARRRTPDAQTPAVSIRWSAPDAHKDFCNAQPIVHCMDHLVSLLVPAALSTPKCAILLSGLTNIATIMTKTEDRVAIYSPPKENYSLEYVITTPAWQEKAKQIVDSKVGDPDIQPLSQSPARQLMKHSSQGAMKKSLNSNVKVADIDQAIIKKTQDYDSAMDHMKAWKITPTYIKVDCRKYVISACAIAVLLVLGGLAIPFSVQSRIRGVDPFQITLFTWITSGFVLVLAKSRYVSNWPWHDFLKGKVVCRSLSDLTDVSSLDTQIILQYLLHKEWKTLLVTSGPYNGLFTRKCDPRTHDQDNVVPQTEGFSIDRPVALSTMYAAGFVMLKVASMDGEDLICLDGRKGAGDYGSHGRKANWMACRNFNEDILESAGELGTAKKKREHKVLFLRRIEFRWERVLGLYTKESHFG